MSYVANIFHLLLSSCILLGLYDVLGGYFEKRDCEMSYMYETPQYKQIPLPKDIAEKFPRYGLYLYGEGQYYRRISSLELEGNPVLFIPGNGGSMKQCRSVASFLLRKAEKRQWKPHFNVFSIDFDEERTAIYGGTLDDQIEFVAHSIKVILKLYAKSEATVKPQSVVLVAHSMGGMVARGVFALPNFDPGTINVMYTLATPHLHPVISFDTHIASAYSSINSYWRENQNNIMNVSIVSASGGDSDFQVNGAVARLPSYITHSVSTTTTSMPRVWVSADHQCIVWCKQVVLAVTRSLFDMVDADTGHISDDLDWRMKVIHHHFVHHSGISDLSKLGKASRVRLLDSYEVHQLHDLQWTSIQQMNRNSAYYFYDLVSLKQQGKSHIVARTTVATERWILACGSVNCTHAVDLSAFAYLTPDFKVAKVDLESLLEDNIMLLIFKVSKRSDDLGHIDVNVLSEDDGAPLNFTVPSIFSNLWTLNQGYTSIETIGKIKNGFYHKISLNGLHSIYHAYKVILSPTSVTQRHTPLVEIELPTHPGYKYSKSNQMTIKLVGTSGYEVPTLHVYTDGDTEYTITIKADFMQFLGQILRFIWPVLPSMVCFNVMLAFSYQLKSSVSGKMCLSTKQAHSVSAKPYKIQPFINFVKKLYTHNWFCIAWHATGLPIPDAVRLDEEFGIWFALTPLVMFLFGAEIFRLINFIQSSCVEVFGRIYYRMMGYLTFEGIAPSSTSSVIHTVVLATLVARCSGLAIIYICILNFLDLCALRATSLKDSAMGNDAPENIKNPEPTLADGKSKGGTETKSPASQSKGDKQEEANKCTPSDPMAAALVMKQSIQLLWVQLALLSIPSIYAWAKGHNTFEKDPHAAVAMFSSLLFILHRLQDAALMPSLPRRVTCRVLYPLTIIASIVCLHSIHRLQYFIVSFISVYVAMQYFG